MSKSGVYWRGKENSHIKISMILSGKYMLLARLDNDDDDDDE